MKLKRGITVLWVLFGISFFITLVLLGRGGKDRDQSGEDKDGACVLEVYAWYDEIDTFSTLAKGFMEKYPDIEVNVHYLPNNEISQGLQIALNGDRAVDVVAISTPAAAAQLVDRDNISLIMTAVKI